MENETPHISTLNSYSSNHNQSPLREAPREAPSLPASLKFVSIMKSKLASTRATKEKEKEDERDAFQVLPEWSGMCELNHLGFPGTIQCVAFDPVQSLLALGTSSGQLIILGQQGLTLRFQIFKFGHFQKIIFLSHLPLIVTLNSVNTIHLIDLANLTSNQIYRSPHLINTISSYPHTKWIFLGLDDGRILLLDIIYGWVSNFLLPPINCPVIKILPHPTNFHQILVGYIDGRVILYDLRQSRPIKKFDFNENPNIETKLHLTALSWNPNVDEFVCGFDNGWLVFWNCLVDEPIAIRTINDAILDIGLEMALPDSYERIFDIKWCSYSNDSETTTLFVAGGDILEGDQSVRKLDFKLSDYNNLQDEILFNVPSIPINITVFPKDTPWYGGYRDPQVVTVLCNMGELKGFTTDAAELELPYILETRSVNAQPFNYIFDCPAPIFETLTDISRVKPQPRLELNGGIVQPPAKFTNLELLVALDPRTSILRFYDASRYHRITNLHYLKLNPNQFPSFRNFGELKQIGMDVEDGYIWLGMENGALLIFEFCVHVECKRHSPHPSRVEFDQDIDEISGNYPSQDPVQKENNFLSVENIAVKLKRSHSVSSIHSQMQIQSNLQTVVVDLNNDCRFRLDWFKEKIQDDVKPYPYCSILGLEETPSLLKVVNSILVAGDKLGNLVIFNLKTRHFLYPFTPLTSTEEAKPNATKNPNISHFNQSNDYVTSCYIPERDSLKYLLIGTKNGHLFRYNFENTISGLELCKVECIYSTKSSETLTYVNIFSYQMTQEELLSTSKTPSTPGMLIGKLASLTLSNSSESSLNGGSHLSPTDKLKAQLDKPWTNLVKQMSSKKSKKKKSEYNDFQDDNGSKNGSKHSLDSISESIDSETHNQLSQTPNMNSRNSQEQESSSQNGQNGHTDQTESITKSPEVESPTTLENPKTKSSPPMNTSQPGTPKNISMPPVADPSIKELLIVGSETNLNVVRFDNFISLAEGGAHMSSEFGKIIQCRLIHQDGHPILICVSDVGIVHLYQLPDLLVVLRSKIVDWNPNLSHSLEISNQGKIFYKGSPSEAKLSALFFNEETEALSTNLLGQLYNPRRICPELPSSSKGWWSSFSEIRQDTILAMFDRDRPIDLRPIDRSQNFNSLNTLAANGLRVHSPQPSVASASSPVGEAPKSKLGQVLAQNTDKLKERYEELEKLDDKTKQTADAAQGFLEAVKEYTAKQQNKKWYQF